MKNQWMIWAFFGVVFIVVIFAFNYQGREDNVPLSEIFKEEPNDQLVKTEYEYVQDTAQPEGSPSAGEQTLQDNASSALASQNQQAAKVQTTTAQQAPAVYKSAQTLSSDQAVSGFKAEDGGSDFLDTPYTIQIASYKDVGRAEREYEKIKKEGLTAYLIQKDLKDRGVWHRIYVGRFATRSQAEEYLSSTENKFKGGIIISPK